MSQLKSSIELYSKAEYEKLFSVRIQQNLRKIERIKQYYQKFSGVPQDIFKVMDEQKERLEKAKEKHKTDTISPFLFV